jgi:peptidoglycan/xylan/chitin deacetylase (PgdA/CDA1 family)
MRASRLILTLALGSALALPWSRGALAPVELTSAPTAAVSSPATTTPAGSFVVLCYHDVADDARGEAADTFSVHRLVEHFEWLKAEGWTVISVDDLLAARAGGKALPPKAVLLTFDDGYESFATRVLPLLEAYRYPAVFAFVTHWLATPPDATIDYGGTPVPRTHFVTPEQLRRIAASPWVEIASHSDDLHQALPANRAGNTLPAGTVRRYDATTDRYETDDEFRARVQDDLARSARFLEQATGRRPRALAWPYGRYDADGIVAAQAAGFTVLFGLEPGRGQLDRLDRVPRLYPARDLTAAGLARLIQPDVAPGPHRYAVVKLSDLAADSDAAAEENLGRLIEATRRLGLSALHLEAFADDNADGRPDAAFAPGGDLPVRRDYLGRAAWQLRTRAGVDIILRVPQRGPSERDWRAIGRHAVFDGVLFTDHVAGRDAEAVLDPALAVLRHYQPNAKLLLRVPSQPSDAGAWAARAPYLVLLPDDDAAAAAAWATEPAARGRVVVPLRLGSSAPGDTWLARGVTHFGLEAAPLEGPLPAWAISLAARVDPFSAPTR